MKPIRVAAPCLTTSNRTAPISANCAVVTAGHEAPASVKDILERVSTVSAELQHTAIEAEIRILARRFKIEVVPEGQTYGPASKKLN